VVETDKNMGDQCRAYLQGQAVTGVTGENWDISNDVENAAGGVKATAAVISASAIQAPPSIDCLSYLARYLPYKRSATHCAKITIRLKYAFTHSSLAGLHNQPGKARNKKLQENRKIPPQRHQATILFRLRATSRVS